MKIVHILTRLLRAGSEENTLLTSAGQMSRGHDVVILHGRDVLPDNARQMAPGIELIEAPNLIREVKPERDLAAFREIRRILLALRPDVVHTHQSKAGIIGRIAARSAHVPLIVHGVHILPFLGVGQAKKTAFLWSERGAARVTDGFIHVSDGMHRACLDHRVGRGKPHFVVPSGFDLDRFARATPPPDRQEIVGEPDGTGRPFVIAMLAAFERRKQHLELLRNIAGFLKDTPQMRLVFAGEGPLKGEVERTVTELGLERQVTLVGFRNDPERIIAMADACIHCSDREGYPRAVLQYLASGKPVVMFDLPGIADVLHDGVNGYIVPQNSWSGMVDRLAELVRNPALRASISAEAAATDLAKWDASKMGERTMMAYRDLQSRSVVTPAGATLKQPAT